jgi:hypothetical protein
MRGKTLFIFALLLVLASTIAEAKDKKNHTSRGMLESMQSVPCGAKERGLTGLGSVFGSVGVQHVNSHEQLCPQYLLRTDEMDYHIRPLDQKHAAVLPVGHEAEFKIKKDRLFLKPVDGDKKTRAYQVVSMQPPNTESGVEATAYHPAEKPAETSHISSEVNKNSDGNKVSDGNTKVNDTRSDPPPQ